MNQLIKQLEKNKIKFKEYLYFAPYFRKRWEDAFVHHLNESEKEKIYLYGDRYCCGYLWHVFSNERKSHFVKAAANKAFDMKKKTKCYVFHQRLPEVLLIERADTLKAIHFEQEEDVYIVDEHFTWTYVVTHESDFGPYYSEADYLN
ncbi:DUF4275 family protein [Solibacillus sp. A46]|uniref:DUF4275 family protein n=1 Tax=Solibacillus faecavium TaxID=2762221 RepID=A0ABR8XWK8_9BACL|nr:DUF4275 family protein [Solibacillus faecavium]MBD8036328.1 DUF4275 family protein [Solibacillus faecavium]